MILKKFNEVLTRIDVLIKNRNEIFANARMITEMLVHYYNINENDIFKYKKTIK